MTVQDLVNALGVNGLKELIISNFPLPTPRDEQIQALHDVVDHVCNGKRRIIIDGPVGSGKSAINYAILKTFGGGAYVTPFKQLQDQIMSEGWSDVKNIKGRREYSCNYATSCGVPEINCGYTGGAFKTCRVDEERPSPKGNQYDKESMVSGIREQKMRRGYNSNEFDKVSGFNDGVIEEYGGTITKVMRSFEEYLCGDDEDPESVNATTFIGCCYNRAIECPVETHRLLCRMALIKVMNPDVMCLLGDHYPELKYHNVLVYDEAHKIPDVIHRLFTAVIPSGILEKAGLDIDIKKIDLYKSVSETTKLLKSTHFRDLMLGTGLDPKKPFHTAIMVHEQVMDYDPYELLTKCVTGKIHPVVYDFFCSIVEGKYERVTTESVAMVKNIGDDGFMVFSEVIEKLVEILSQYRDVEKPFFLTPVKVRIEDLARDFPAYSGKKNVEVNCTEIKPNDVAGLMNWNFYNHSELVVLSSGTWIGWESTLREIGVYMGEESRKNIGIVKVKSTFPAARRPVYMAAEGVDMSSKCDNGKYWYDENPKEFADITWRNILRLRDRGNIILHCNSFKIVKILAENLPEYDPNKFIVHMNSKETILNKPSGKIVTKYDKDAVLKLASVNHNSGLIFISPSLVEGVDFKYDRARSQIIVKSPIPYMGDAYVKEMSRKDPSYIDRIIWMNLVQMYGRVMRATDDEGVTLIQDLAAKRTFSKAFTKDGEIKRLNIGYFAEAVQAKVENKRVVYL